MSEFRDTLRRVLADRHSPEAQGMFLVILKYIDQRAHATWRQRYRDLLSPTEVEELVGESMTRLMAGALARFQGDSLPSLYAFVRTLTDRTVAEAAQRRLRERRGNERMANEPRAPSEGGALRASGPEVEVTEVPLPEKDQVYLRELLGAGSRAALARQRGQSRAAVTRMIQRIQSRIADLTPDERMTVEVWMLDEARAALTRRVPAPTHRAGAGPPGAPPGERGPALRAELRAALRVELPQQ